MKHTFSRLPASELQIMQVLWEGHPDMSRLKFSKSSTGRGSGAHHINSLLSRLGAKDLCL